MDSGTTDPPSVEAPLLSSELDSTTASPDVRRPVPVRFLVPVPSSRPRPSPVAYLVPDPTSDPDIPIPIPARVSDFVSFPVVDLAG